jgi:hypothetical protein
MGKVWGIKKFTCKGILDMIATIKMDKINKNKLGNRLLEMGKIW